MKWFLALVLCTILAGCSSTMDIPSLEQRTLTLYNEELERQKYAPRGTKLSLAHESGNKYTGFVDLNDGSRSKMDVTYDGANIVFDATPVK